MMRLARSIVGEAEAEAVRRILCEDGYLGMGSEVQRFEADIAAYLGVPPTWVVSASTGTAALHMAVAALSEPGDEVLVPSLTYVASFQAISACGAVPVACDARPDSATIDLEDAARRLTARTKAIMPVHYASNPFALDAVYAFARQHGLRVIEDAAHAFGCFYKGQKIGSFGDVVCFSFDGIKNITCGEGGCLVTSDQQVADCCRDGRLLAVEKDSEKRFSGQRSWEFDVVRQGWRYHMSNIMAAIGRTQLARFENEFAPARRRLAALYRARLEQVPGLALLTEEPDAHIVPHLFPVRVLEGRKDHVVEAMEAAGIPTGVHYKPNHLLTFFGGGRVTLPATDKLHSELVTLPLHPGLADSDVETVCATLVAVLGVQTCPS